MTISSVAELSVDELKNLIREVVTQTITELLGDPDVGLDLRDEFEAELQRSLDTVQIVGETSSLAEVANKLGLEW